MHADACPYEAKLLEEISERRKELKSSCVTPVEEGMKIITDREEKDREERAKENSFQFSRACSRWFRHAILAKAQEHLL